MKQHDHNGCNGCYDTRAPLISRRVAMGSSGLAILGGLSGSAFAQEQEKRGLPRQIQERMDQSRVFSERMRTAPGMEERMKIMEERNAWERNRAVEDLKEQLGVSDTEWAVIKPRVEAVYKLAHPLPSFGPGNAQARTPVEQKSRELREILGNKEATAEEIKAKLTALRAAKEQARQELVKARGSLRQIMTLHQEAVLVLNGLLE